MSADAERDAFIADVEFLLAAREIPANIAARLRDGQGRPMKVAAVAQRLRRYERPDLARPFHAAETAMRKQAARGEQVSAPV